jgi:hypothetical protein
MAGVTSTVVALAGLGMSAAQAVNAKKKAKEARNAAKTAMNQAMSVQETNKMAALQSPDISSSAFQQNAAGTQQAVTGLQEMGPEGAASVASVTEANRRANLDAAQAQAQQDAAKEQIVLATEQGIETERAANQREMLAAEIGGAQAVAAFQEGVANEAIGSAFKSLGSAVGSGGDKLFEGGKYLKSGVDASGTISETSLNPEGLGLWRDAQSQGISWENFLKKLK